jgi:hypothetical protein
MTDEVFMARLHGFAYIIQRGGYGDGPVPDSFQPIIPYFKNADGTINREKTLDPLLFPGITGIEREHLLKIDIPSTSG